MTARLQARPNTNRNPSRTSGEGRVEIPRLAPKVGECALNEIRTVVEKNRQAGAAADEHGVLRLRSGGASLRSRMTKLKLELSANGEGAFNPTPLVS